MKIKNIFKIDWQSPTFKDSVIDLLIKHNGNIVKVSSSLGISDSAFKKGMKKHYPEVNLLEYSPALKRFQLDKEYAQCIYEKYNGDISLIRMELSSSVKSVRLTLMKFEIGGYTLPKNEESNVKYESIKNIDKNILITFLSDYVYTHYQSILMNRYIDHVYNCHMRNIDKVGVYEKHHILPRSLFPQFSKFTKYKWNMAILTPREHFIAHVILHYMIGGAMTSALDMMLSCFRYKGIGKSRQYEKIRYDYRTNLIISNREYDTGYRWYTNGKHNKKYKDGINIPYGYVLGMTANINKDDYKSIPDTLENINKSKSLLIESGGSIKSIMDYFNVVQNNAYVFLRRNSINIHDYQPYSMTYHRYDDIAMRLYLECGKDLEKVSIFIGVSLRSVKKRYNKLGIK